MKVSLIIPVYNVENFLYRCLKSVENQTYKDTEVIIINDGSTDNFYKIIDEFVARNENFICYTIENSGPGGARNYGILKATGDYIVFLDSDDYISEDCIEKLFNAAQKNDSDIVVCNNYDVTEEGEIITLYECNAKNRTTSAQESPEIFFNRQCPWGKIYRKSLFDNLFYATKEWYEDLRLVLKIYLRAEKITYIEDALFFYVQRAGSIMNNAKAIRNLEIITAFEDIISYFNEKDVYEKFKAEIDYLIIEHIAVATITRVVMSGAEEKDMVIEKLQKYVSQFDGIYNNKYLPLLGLNKRLVLFFNKHKLYFLTKLCMKAKSKIAR